MRHRRSARSKWVILPTLIALFAAACGGNDDASTNNDTDGAGGEPTETEAGTETEASGEWEPEYVNGVLQPLPDGFPEEGLSFISPDDAGSDDGIYARHLAAALEKVVPVRTQVVDRPDFDTGFGAWDMLREIESDELGNQGYSLMVTSHTGTVGDLLSSPVASELNVGVDDLNWVITTEELPWVLVGRTGAPWGNSIEEMIQYGKENPGELKYLSRGPGSSLTVSTLHYMNELGVEVNEVVTGGPEEITIAAGAGAGDFGMSLTGISIPFVDEGRVVLLACTGNEPCGGDYDHNPPGMGDVAGVEPDPWGSRRGIFVSREVPELHRQWLYEALSTAIQDEDYVANRSNLPGINLVDLDHEESGEVSQAVYDATCTILREQELLDPTVDC